MQIIFVVTTVIILILIALFIWSAITVNREEREKDYNKRVGAIQLLMRSLDEDSRFFLLISHWNQDAWSHIYIEPDLDKKFLCVCITNKGDIEYTYMEGSRTIAKDCLPYGTPTYSEFFSELNSVIQKVKTELIGSTEPCRKSDNLDNCETCKHYIEICDWPPNDDVIMGHYCELTMLNNPKVICGAYESRHTS